MKQLESTASSDVSSNSVLYTSLSLFIILLAFFMVLSSNSSFDEDRVRPVLESLEQTFTTLVFSECAAPSFVEDVSRASGDGFALEDLSKLFKAEASGIEPQLIPSRGILSLEIPKNVFIEIIQRQIQATSPTSLNATLLRVLRGDDIKATLQMEIWIKPDDQTILKSADDWISNLSAQNIDEDRISLGVSNAVTNDKVLLLFRPYYPYEIR